MGSQLNLGELIEILHAIPNSTYNATLYGWGELMSWRGDYSQLTLTDGYATIGSAYTEACLAVDSPFHGYKGGAYVMNLGTMIYGDGFGQAGGVMISGVRFVLDKKDMNNPRAEIIREW